MTITDHFIKCNLEFLIMFYLKDMRESETYVFPFVSVEEFLRTTFSLQNFMSAFVPKSNIDLHYYTIQWDPIEMFRSRHTFFL